MSADDHAVEEILGSLAKRGDEQDRIAIGDAVETIGHRGYGPFLLLPALIEISPIGGIPGVPTLLALIIALFAAQIAAGREHMWLPGFILRLEVSGERARSAAERMRPVGRWLDRWFHGRFEALTRPAARRVAAATVILLCATVPPLELVPFASTAPMAAIALFGLAMMLRDGLVMGVAFAAAAAALGIGGWALITE